jgi:hypothetical protein
MPEETTMHSATTPTITPIRLTADLVQAKRPMFEKTNPEVVGRGVGPIRESVITRTEGAAALGGDASSVLADDPGSSVTVSDGGGRKMTTAQLYVLFWGDGWNSVPAGSPSKSDVQADIATIVTSPYLHGLQEYTPFTLAAFQWSSQVTGHNPPGNFTSVDTNYIAWYNMAFGPIPERLDTIVCVMMPPGITHGSVTGQHSYTLAPNLVTVPVLWVIYGSREDISSTFSHELVETIVDPDGTGIQVNPRNLINWNEIGDACNSFRHQVNGVTVQPYWSQQANACITPIG